MKYIQNKSLLRFLVVMMSGLTFANAEILQFKSGVAIDTNTKLMWQNNNDAIDLKIQPNWHGAVEYCENLSLAQFDDWKLPDRHTLKTLHLKKNSLQLDYILYHYWSYSSEADNLEWAWCVDIHDNDPDQNRHKDDGYAHVRCVRDGSSEYKSTK